MAVAKLMGIRQSHFLTTRQVADQARLPHRDVYHAEIGGLVTQQVAETIATALSTLAGKHYSIEALGLTLKKGAHEKVSHYDAICS